MAYRRKHVIRRGWLHVVPVTLCILFVLVSTALAKPKTIPDGYSVETIDVPEDIDLEVGGLDFSSNGALYVTTRYGEVWMYRDGDWEKFAEGLQNALGIEVTGEGSQAYVVQKPELTELIDTDGDREVEGFRTVSDEWGFSGQYHEFAYGPVRDDQGNFYVSLNLSSADTAGKVGGNGMGHIVPYRGTVVKISPDGRQLTPYAYGFRSPAGIAMSPDDELFVTDNQGDWMPVSPLIHVREGRFYGHPSSLVDHPDFKDKNLDKIPNKKLEKYRTPPALWFPYNLAKSPTTPVFDTNKEDFGPFDGQMFIGDQTQANLMRVDLEKIRGSYQGVVFNFIDGLQSGIVRSTFAPDQRSLVVGQTHRGWPSTGSESYGLQRIVYDGETIPYSIKTIKLTSNGFRAHFTHPVNRKAAAQPEKYSVKSWHYNYHATYGSDRVDQQTEQIQSVDVSGDGRKTRINLSRLETGRVYEISLDLPAADGSILQTHTGYYTVNRKKK